jgi:hypothetical protein
MAVFSIEELKKLSENIKKPCVSIYMHTHRTGRELVQDPIRFKNLVNDTEADLKKTGMKGKDISDFLKPVKELLNEKPLWQHMGDGLAVFRSPEKFIYYRLPIPFEELQVTGNSFHLKPLMPLLTGDGLFYILVMSQNSVRLLRGSRHAVNQVEVDDMPRNLADALKIDEYLQSMQFHTGTSMRQTGRAAVFHGHGGGDDDELHEIRQYLRKIDDALCNFLGTQNVPVVLAGVDYLFPIYREVSNYKNLYDEGIAGNHEFEHHEDIHKKSWDLLRQHFKKGQALAVEKYYEAKANGLASDSLPEILKAAAGGRVETLFVDQKEHIWGKHEPGSGAIFLEDDRKPDNNDLLDVAAINTIRKGGTVYAIDGDNLPDKAPLAAVFRY